MNKEEENLNKESFSFNLLTPPHQPFNFLNYIKNPERSDEKKIELHDYVSTLNKENYHPPEFKNSKNIDIEEEVKKQNYFLCFFV